MCQIRNRCTLLYWKRSRLESETAGGDMHMGRESERERRRDIDRDSDRERKKEREIVR